MLYGVFVAGTPWFAAPALFAGGFIAWTLTEYWLHRTLFHWIPNDTWGEKMHFFIHGVHHKWVFDKYRLVMPRRCRSPWRSCSSACTGASAWRCPPGSTRTGSGCSSPGKMAGYANYDLTHYYIHHGKPKLKMYKRLRAHHNAHHHNPKHKDRKYGVSTTLWDHVFRTY